MRCNRAKRTPNVRPLASASSTLLSLDDATNFITLVIFATLLVARMRSLTAHAEQGRGLLRVQTSTTTPTWAGCAQRHKSLRVYNKKAGCRTMVTPHGDTVDGAPGTQEGLLFGCVNRRRGAFLESPLLDGVLATRKPQRCAACRERRHLSLATSNSLECTQCAHSTCALWDSRAERLTAVREALPAVAAAMALQCTPQGCTRGRGCTGPEIWRPLHRDTRAGPPPTQRACTLIAPGCAQPRPSALTSGSPAPRGALKWTASSSTRTQHRVAHQRGMCTCVVKQAPHTEAAPFSLRVGIRTSRPQAWQNQSSHPKHKV